MNSPVPWESVVIMLHSWKKNTAVFMTSQAISILGSSLVQYAIMWHITLTTQSGVYATVSILCGFVPTLLLSPFGGVWADRYNRKMLIMLADGGIALCTLILAVVFLAGYQEIWLLFAVLAVRSFGNAVQTPCIGAMLPDIVPGDQLTRVNGLNSSVQSLILLASPMLSGVLLGFVPLHFIFFIDVVTAVLAIYVLFAFFHLPEKERVERVNSDYFQEMRQGIRYIFRHPYLCRFFVFCAAIFVLAAPVSFLTPLQVARSFNGTEFHLSAIEVAFSVGMLLGGLLMATWGGLKNRIRTMSFACMVMGGMVVGLGITNQFWLYLVLMALIGTFLPVYNTPAMVLLQERVDPEYMGRTFSVMTMLSSSVMPLAMLVFGPLADRVAIEWLLLATGVLMLLVAVLLLRNRTLLEAGDRQPEGQAEVKQ